RPARPVSMNIVIPTVASPATPSPRSNLVSKRLFGPRTPDTTPRGAGERRKTVTWDETCDVVEFDREDDMSIASVNGTDASRDSEESEQEELASPPQSLQSIPSLPESSGIREYYGPDRDSGGTPSPILSGSINELADDMDGEKMSISNMITEDEMPTPQRHDIDLPDEGYSHNSDEQDVISHPNGNGISEMQSFLTNMNSFRDDSVSTHEDSFTARLKTEPDVETSLRLSESRSPERFPRISRDAIRRQVEQQRMEGGSDDSFEHHQSASYRRSRHSHSPSPVRPESAVVVSSPFKQSNRSDVNLEDVHSALDRLMLGVERGFEPSILSNQSELDRDDDTSSIDDGPSFAPQGYGRAPDFVESTVIIDEDQSINEGVDAPLSRESTVMTNTSTSSSSGPFTPRASDAESPMMHTLSHEDHFSSSKPLPPPPDAITPPIVHVTLEDDEVIKSETLAVPAVSVRRGSTIKKREEAIKAKRREQRALEGRPSRRRSQSTGDLKAKQYLLISLKFEEPDQLDLVHQDDPDLTDAVQSELAKRQPAKKTYMMKQRRPTIYASDSRVGHLGVAGDVHGGRAWKAVRRPSDMDIINTRIVIGIKDLDIPLPSQPTYFTCVLNNGIHFVETPACRLERESLIEQEFELIENEKLEFTLTLKVRKDPHINQILNPPARPAYVPAARVETPTKTRNSVMSFFSGQTKRQSKIVVKEREPIPQPIESNDPFGRYLKKDLSMARAMVTFKDIVEHCDTKLFETSYPLIAQCAVGRDVVTKTVGEIVLHIFRLPPIPGVAPDDLPQSLDECTRGLRHTWRRRSLQVMGANLIAYNDVTKKPITTMDLRKVTLVEDDGRNGVNPIIITPPRDSSSENRLDKPKTLRRQRSFNALAGIEHSFRVIFDGNENDEVCFFADNAEEKAKWMEIFSALVGRIPHNPLWAEIMWQRQQESS
ncbi:12428_t:CDS:2, partial [Acaulospora colombiana]